MDLKEIRSLIQLLEETGLSEIEIEEHGRRVRLRKDPAHVGATAVLVHSGLPSIPQTVAAPALGLALALPEFPPVQVAAQETEHVVAINSPIVGTFYRAHQLGADPYVQVGDLVKKGQILCIVEAMKLMNEIESELDGTVSEICVEDKASVEFGQPLLKIAPMK